MNAKKILVALLAVVLIVGCTIGGTLAWLKDSTETVTNTFTSGNIEITLDEAKVDQDGNFMKVETKVDTIGEASRVTKNEYQAIPGKTYSKDPTLTVKKGNEKCYLFVKFEEIGDPDEYYIYDFALDNTDSGWTQGNTENGLPTNVWYIIVEEVPNTAENDTVFHLLVGDKIQVNGEKVTVENMATAAAAELKWTAYAVQYMNDAVAFTPAEAWAIANP